MDKCRRAAYCLFLLMVLVLLTGGPLMASEADLGDFAGGGDDWWAVGGSVVAFVILVFILWWFGSKWIVDNIMTRK